MADLGCRNRVYNGAAQRAAEYFPRMQLEVGIPDYRVESLRENPKQVAPLLERYARVLAGIEDARPPWRPLGMLTGA